MLAFDILCQSCKVIWTGIIFPIRWGDWWSGRSLNLPSSTQAALTSTFPDIMLMWAPGVLTLQWGTLQVPVSVLAAVRAPWGGCRAAGFPWEAVCEGCVGERQVVIWKDETHKPCCKREVQADALLQRNITTGPAAVLFSETGVSLYESQIPKGV